MRSPEYGPSKNLNIYEPEPMASGSDVFFKTHGSHEMIALSEANDTVEARAGLRNVFDFSENIEEYFFVK